MPSSLGQHGLTLLCVTWACNQVQNAQQFVLVIPLLVPAHPGGHQPSKHTGEGIGHPTNKETASTVRIFQVVGGNAGGIGPRWHFA